MHIGVIMEGQRSFFRGLVIFSVRKRRQEDEKNGEEREGQDSLIEIVLQRVEINS